MSKSIGNVIAPSQIMDGSLLPPPTSKRKGGTGLDSQALGADSLRLWVASSDYTRDVVIGQPVLISNQAALLKYRMIIKMLLGSIHQAARTAPITKLDQIALFQLQTVMRDVFAAYDNFEFHKAVNLINRWVNIDVSGFYLEAMKDRLYTGDGGGVVEEIFHGLLRMLTPITPSIVAEAWAHRPIWMVTEYEVKSSMLHPFHLTLDQPLTSRSLDVPIHIGDHIPWLLNANTAIKSAQEDGRAQKMFGSSLASSVVLQLPDEAREVFDVYADELASIYIVSSVELDAAVGGAWQFSAEFDAPGGKGKAWILPPKEAKCPRCWRYVAPSKDELCKRCDGIVNVP